MILTPSGVLETAVVEHARPTCIAKSKAACKISQVKKKSYSCKACRVCKACKYCKVCKASKYCKYCKACNTECRPNRVLAFDILEDTIYDYFIEATIAGINTVVTTTTSITHCQLLEHTLQTLHRQYHIPQHSTAQHSTPQHTTPHHTTAHHSTPQHSTAQHSTAQHSTAQHSTAQHSTAHRTTQHHTTPHHTTPHHTTPHHTAQYMEKCREQRDTLDRAARARKSLEAKRFNERQVSQ